MPFKKYARKQGKKAMAFAKKRYTTRTGGARVNRMAKDIYAIKRSLNVEHKHFDCVFGSAGGAFASAQTPSNNNPLTLALPVPSRGVAYNNRIGNQIKITHITSKLEFLFENTSDLFSRRTASVRLLFAKAGRDVPTVADLYEQDQNGHYTRASFTNSQEWNKYVWIKPLNTFKSYTENVNRYPQSNSSGVTEDPASGTILNFGVHSTVASQPLNLTKFYVNKQTKCNVRVMFENGSDTVVDQMKPYLIFMSDCVLQSGLAHDPVKITGQIRFTYVDN